MQSNMSLLSKVEAPILRKDSTDVELTEGKIVLIVIMCLANVFMFLGNLLSIITICSCHLRRKVSYWFVLNLAIIDFLISVTVIPLNSVWEYYGIWPLGRAACEFFTFADISFSTISAYSIVLVSIDKYLYISYSIHYQDRMTKKLSIILIVAVWISVFLFTLISMLSEVGTREDFKDHFIALNNGTKTCIFVMTDSFVIPSAILCFFIPFIILCFTSSRIICIAVRHIKKIHAGGSNCQETESSDSSRSVVKIKDKKRDSSSLSCTPNHDNQNNNNTSPKVDEKKPIPAISKKVERGSIASDKGNSCELTGFFLIEQTLTDDSGEQYTVLSSQSSSSEGIGQRNGQTDRTCDGSLDVLEKPRSSSFNRYLRKDSSLKQTDSFRSIAKKQSPYCKLFGTVTIVIACFVIMFAPYYITTMIDVVCHCVTPWVYEDILSVLYYMHSLVNPFIYMATDRKYKAALKSLLRKVKLKFCHQCNE